MKTRIICSIGSDQLTRPSLSEIAMKIAIFLSMSVLFTTGTFATSYEGTIGEYFVWVDISISTKDNSVSGSYFYKKFGNEIRLNGIKNGDTVRLVENNSKGKVTGRFICVLGKNSMNGVWVDPKDTLTSNGRLAVVLEKSEPEYRKYAKMPKLLELFVDDRERSPSGQTLADIAQEYSDKSSGYTQPATIDILFYKKDILSVCIRWENTGSHMSLGEMRFAFSLQSKKEIQLQNEFDSVGMKKFYTRYNPEVASFITGFGAYRPLEEWPDPNWLFDDIEVNGVAFDHYETDSDIPGESRPILIVDDTTRAIDRLSDWSLTPTGLNITHPGTGYFGFPQAFQAVDATFEITIPYNELKKYLKPKSILKHICK